MISRLVGSGVAESRHDLLGTLLQYADRGTVYVDVVDEGLCRVDPDTEYAILGCCGWKRLEELEYPALVIVTGGR